jgi:hypothetical protein
MGNRAQRPIQGEETTHKGELRERKIMGIQTYAAGRWMPILPVLDKPVHK